MSATDRVLFVDDAEQTVEYGRGVRWEGDGTPVLVASKDPCPVVIGDMDDLPIKRATYNDLSRVWSIPRLEAVRALRALSDNEVVAMMFDPAYWEGTHSERQRGAGAKAAREPGEPTPPREPKPDATAVRRDAMAGFVRATPSTVEAIAREFKVSGRTVEFDLAAIGAVVHGKDGRRKLWTVSEEVPETPREE